MIFPLRRFAAAIATLMAAAPVAAEPAKVKAGLFITLSDAGMFVAEDKGYFREQDLEVEVGQVDSAATVNTQLASGALDVGGGSPGAGVYNAVRQGIPITIVADKGSSLPGYGFFAFMVRRDLAGAVKTPADLRGRTLGVTGYGAGAAFEVTVNRLIAPAGLKEEQIRISNLSFADIMAGLGTGALDVGVLVEPLVTQALDKDIAVAWKRFDEVYPAQQSGAIMFGPGMMKRPEVGRRFMVAYVKGLRFYNDALTGKAPREELVAILAKHTSVKNPDLYRRMVYPGLHPDGVLNTAGMADDMKWWVSVGRMKEPVDLAKAVDTSFVEHAVRQLGPYR